jgi:Asp-tRNA(Asn)/Glu-tRNA(Gln) amidotransferase A subunit family amidase
VDLREALAGFAGWQGYRHDERADAWIARLELNRPELEAFRAAATPDVAAYVPRATSVAPAEGDATGEVKLIADAARALERARGAGSLNAFTWLARSVEHAPQGSLAGVPIAIKDLMLVKGAPLTSGSRASDERIAERDAPIVARIRRAGAAIVGLTNLHEFAYGITSDNPRFGRVVNPVAPARIPGGSSGGSAAAIAAGIVRLAVGTDTSGSIRIPAACCGIVGLKPSYDALPRNGVVDLAWSLDHVGPMAATVEECAALFAAMLELPAAPRWARRNLDGITIARLGGYFAAPLDDAVRRALDEAAAAATSDGARVIERSIDGMELAPAIQLNTIAPEATAFHEQRLAARGERFGEDVRVRLEMGLFLPAPWYVKAQRLRAALAARMDALFEEAGVLLCPTLRTPAPAIGASQVTIGERAYPLHTAVTNLTLPFNLGGVPAVSIPWSLSSEGVPIAIQVATPRGNDWRALAVAQRLARAAPWQRAANARAS